MMKALSRYWPIFVIALAVILFFEYQRRNPGNHFPTKWLPWMGMQPLDPSGAAAPGRSNPANPLAATGEVKGSLN